MPTPFMHLCAAYRIATHPQLQSIRPQLDWSAHLLGHIAPDVNNVNGKAREETHFIRPIDPVSRRNIPHRVMLHLHPEQLTPSSPAMRSFVAGLVAHLKADEIWMRIIGRSFFAGVTAEARPARHFAHNIFRTYYDHHALMEVPRGAADALRALRPMQWYAPMATDADLLQWSNMIVKQLDTQTSLAIPIFAQRLKLPEQEFVQKLQDKAWLQEKVFVYCPADLWEQYWTECDRAMVDTILEYWTLVETGNALPHWQHPEALVSSRSDSAPQQGGGS